MTSSKHDDLIENKLKTELETARLKIETGKYLEQLRKSRRLSRQALSEIMGISANYIREIENGFKLPSDNIIRNFATHFDVDEDELFIRYGKTPLISREEFENSIMLQRMLVKIGKSLTDEQKANLYEKLYQQCVLFISDLQILTKGDEP